MHKCVHIHPHTHISVSGEDRRSLLRHLATLGEDIYTLNVTAFDTMAMKWIVACRIQLQSKLSMHMLCASDRQAYRIPLQSKLRMHMLCASDRQAYKIQLQSKLRMHMLCASDRQAHDNKTQCRITTCIQK